MATDTELLNMLYSGVTTAMDFHYDQLQAPPLLSLLTIYDIDELRKIATSVGLSGNVDKKYKMINDIMKPRGFIKLSAGTNRVVYRHPELPNIVIKIAVDRVGIKDNPDEFYNQQFIKPFCCKVFEVSPCGTVGLFERVERITSKYEFISIAEDVFDVIVNKLVGKYVLNDIGARFMYNWGVRRGFGPVILDFPYLYELDGDKLMCSQRMEDGSICYGDIDYDDQFNFLVCKKCGRVYSAMELSKPKKDRGIFVRSKGGTEMKVTLMRGNTVIKTNDSKDMYDIMKKNTNHDENVSVIKGKSVGDKQVTNPNDIKMVPSFVLKKGKETVYDSDRKVKVDDTPKSSGLGSFSAVRISEEEEKKLKDKQEFNAFATMNGMVVADKKDESVAASAVRGEDKVDVKEDIQVEEPPVAEEVNNTAAQENMELKRDKINEEAAKCLLGNLFDSITREDINRFIETKPIEDVQVLLAALKCIDITPKSAIDDDEIKQNNKDKLNMIDENVAAKRFFASVIDKTIVPEDIYRFTLENQPDELETIITTLGTMSEYVASIVYGKPLPEHTAEELSFLKDILEDSEEEKQEQNTEINQLISPVEFLDTPEQEIEEEQKYEVEYNSDLKLSIAMRNRNRLKARPSYRGKKEE